MGPWLQVEWNGLPKEGFCGKALWNFCYTFTFVADATLVTVDLLYDCSPGNSTCLGVTKYFYLQGV